MGLETATYINGLVPTNPTQGDLVSAGDDHIRLLKSTLKNTFPNLTAAVTVTAAELNYLSGVTSNVQTQITGKANVSHVHAESQISDENILARIFSDETIEGLWTFVQVPLFGEYEFLHENSSIQEAQIADGTLLARLAANETVTGAWNFSTPPLVQGLGTLRWATAGLTAGPVFLVTATPADTGTPGSIYLVY